ncbi:MAG: hypothetical protein RLZZ505_2290 [Verrucomicrobiota bacterium]|jgi:hypothetical protein
MHPELPGIPPAPPRPPPRKRKSTDYLIALTRALHRLNLAPQLHALLITVARDQTTTRAAGANVPTLALTLGCTFQCITLHLRNNSELFTTHTRPHPQANLIRLSREGVEILREVRRFTRAYLPSK